MNFSKKAEPHIPDECQKKTKCNSVQSSSIDCGDLNGRVSKACSGLSEAPGSHSFIEMHTSGFEYIKVGDAARCNECGLGVSNWTPDMHPFTIHKRRRPNCPFVLKMLPTQEMITPIIKNPGSIATLSADKEQPLKRLKIDNLVTTLTSKTLVEVDIVKQVRKRSFSHWARRSSPSTSQMIDAGFFNCNVGDRVICIYCNIICQQWTPNSDDPCEVHKTLSPKCAYVISMLISSQTSVISIINEVSTSTDPFRCHEIVYTAACNTNYIEIPKRAASFATWPNENAPPVDDLVRAGFFFTGTKTIVTCFYCNGSLQNWGANDNPMIEHARWFPHCAYAKQLCGAELYRKIQESKRAQQERAKPTDSSNRLVTTGGNSNHGLLQIPDESTLSRFVAARLDLHISQSLLDRNFKLSIIKRCWEDQLRLKHKDFVSDCDLLMACIVLKKQIDHIDGKKENITVPSVAMKKIREKEQAEANAREQADSGSSSTNSPNDNDVEMTTSSTESNTNETNTAASSSAKVAKQKPTVDASPTNLCVLCLEEERRLACIPCGHLATCVPCGHSLRTCPICRREIDAFVRI